MRYNVMLMKNKYTQSSQEGRFGKYLTKYLRSQNEKNKQKEAGWWNGRQQSFSRFFNERYVY